MLPAPSLHRTAGIGFAAGLLWLSATRGLLADGPAASARALAGAAEIVLRGRVLDQEPAPGGVWHRIDVEEVIWAPAEAERPRDAAPLGGGGPPLRAFAHGPGVPDGAVLVVGSTYILGVRRLPPASECRHPFEKRLWNGFRPDLAGERPAIVAADGVLPEADGGSTAEGARRLVAATRDTGRSPASRRELLLSLTGHPEPAIREEAVRQMSNPAIELDAASEAVAQAAFADEIDGPADPSVLVAYLELAETRRFPGLGPLLQRLLDVARREDLAERAAAALERLGRPAALRESARESDARTRRPGPAAGTEPPAAARRLKQALQAARRRLQRAPGEARGDVER